MYTKISANMMLLGLLSSPEMVSAAETESFARCEFNKDSFFPSDIKGTLLIAHYQGRDIYISGNVTNMKSRSEHFLSVTTNSFKPSWWGCSGEVGPFWEPYAASENYNHLRAVIADKKGDMMDYEHRDSLTTMYGENSIIGRSLSIHLEWEKSSYKVACCNIELIDKSVYLDMW